jgi:hypothetical protein
MRKETHQIYERANATPAMAVIRSTVTPNAGAASYKANLAQELSIPTGNYLPPIGLEIPSVLLEQRRF